MNAQPSLGMAVINTFVYHLSGLKDALQFEI